MEEVKTSPILTKMDEIGERIDTLGGTIDQLRVKLGPIMSNLSEEKREKKDRTEGSCALEENLSQFVNKLTYIIQTIDNTKNSIEL